MSTGTQPSGAGRPRLTLMFTMLLCAVTLSACLDSSCNLVGPSETAGSHDETGDNLLVNIYHEREESGVNLGSPSVRVIVGNATPVVVERGEFVTLVLPNVKKGDVFPVYVDGKFLKSCTWTGKLKLFNADASITYIPPVLRGTGLSDPEALICSGWN